MTGPPDSGVDSRVPAWILAGAVLFLSAGLLWSVLPLLNPVLLWFALAGLLFPVRSNRGVVSLLVTFGVLALFWLLRELGAVLAPFVVAVVLAYILNPLVGRIAGLPPLRRWGGEHGRTARSFAVLLLALPLSATLGAGALWGGPWLVREAGELVHRVPAFLAWASDSLRLAIPGFNGVDGDQVLGLLEEWGSAVGGWLAAGMLGVGRGMGLLFTLLGYLVLTPVILFYLMRDWDRVVARVAARIPQAQSGLLDFGRAYDEALAAYLRGQVTVSILVGGMTALGLLLLGFPFAIFLGLVVAIFNVVPYLGVVLSLIPALGIALTLPSPGVALAKVVVVYTVAQSMESAVLSPRIVGDSTGLHPVWILLAISVSGFFFGFVGLLLAVPGAVAVKLLLERSLPPAGA